MKAMSLAEEAGAEKVVRLQVGAAFHSELMKPTQERMAAAMDEVSWNDADVRSRRTRRGRLSRALTTFGPP